MFRVRSVSFFFPKDSYLGELRFFLWVQVVAIFRRLGSAGDFLFRRAGGCRRRALQIYVITHILKIPRPRQDPISPTQRIPRGRYLILSTQRIPRDRDPILSTQTFGYANASPLGGDVEKIGHFQTRKIRGQVGPFF